MFPGVYLKSRKFSLFLCFQMHLTKKGSCDRMKIGFIGLGIMGRPMAKNLLKAGYDVTVDSHSPAAAAELEACGAKVADQPTIGSTCDLVLTMLPNAPQVKQVMLGANGVAAHMQPGSTFIDMTSLNPIASKEIAAELAARGIQMLDAPVSGGEPKAIDGTLSFMVGGEEEVFNTFKPVLLAMGSSAVRCGGIGAGNTTKLANQIIVAANIQAVAEALTLDRACLGDILPDPADARSVYAFVLEDKADFIASNLTEAGRSPVHVERCHAVPEEVLRGPERQMQDATVPSLRADTVLAAMMHTSRSIAAQAIQSGRVEVNHVPLRTAHEDVFEGDIFTVRGVGRYRLVAIGGKSRKDRIFITFYQY